MDRGIGYGATLDDPWPPEKGRQVMEEVMELNIQPVWWMLLFSLNPPVFVG